MKPWKRVEPTIVTKVGYRTMTTKHFVLANGLKVDRTVMHEDGWAAAGAVALTPDNKVILVRQFRPGAERFMEEIPAGIVDKGETPEQCMLRELAEETGYKPGKIEYLGTYSYDAYVNGERHYFLATDCVPTGDGLAHESDEQLEIHLVGIDQLLTNAKNGLMTDPGSVLLAYDRLEKLKEGTK